MFVETILQAKVTTVFTLPDTASLAEAIAQLNAHNIGALVIIGEDNGVVGILSERDIVRTVAAQGAQALAQSVGQVMTRDVVTCSENDACAEIMERMTSHKFRHLPVLRDNTLIGLISIGDVVKERVDEIERESEAMRDYIRTA